MAKKSKIWRIMCERYQRKKNKFDASCVSDAKRKLKKPQHTGRDTRTKNKEREDRTTGLTTRAKKWRFTTVQKSKLFTLIFFFTCVNFVALGCTLSTSHWPQFSLCLNFILFFCKFITKS
jgi:hypothetical protein